MFARALFPGKLRAVLIDGLACRYAAAELPAALYRTHPCSVRFLVSTARTFA